MILLYTPLVSDVEAGLFQLVWFSTLNASARNCRRKRSLIEFWNPEEVGPLLSWNASLKLRTELCLQEMVRCAIQLLRIIKGRPFEIGFGCDAKLYRKGHPQ